MRNLWVVVLLLFCFSTLQAEEKAGVALPDRIMLGTPEVALTLNGTGIRKKLFFSVYLASLYLPAETRDAGEILAADQPNRVQMDMLYSKVDRQKLVEAWNDGFSANLTADDLAALRPRIDAFNGIFGDLVEGDRVQFDYLPEQGTRISINGVEQGVIQGHDFNQALLRIWLGDSPVTESLKQDLLGL